MRALVRGRARWAALIAIVAGALAVGGIAYATIPNGGVIYGCYMKSGGNLRVIDNTVTKCKSTETSVNWNQTGPPGGQGQPGEQGPPGISGYEVIESESALDSDDHKVVFADCPTGKVAIGGGSRVDGAPTGTVALRVSSPSVPSADSWIGAAYEVNATADDWRLSVEVICATVAT